MTEGQGNDITMLLGLEGKGFEVTGVQAEGRSLLVEMRAGHEEVSCPRCGSPSLYRHGKSRSRRVRHGWILGKRLELHIQGRQRWKCRDCGKTFSETVEFVRGRCRYTKHAEAEVLRHLRARSFRNVSRELGMSYGTLRRILSRVEAGPKMMEFLEGEEEIHLGIDEHSFSHHDMVIIVTELRKRRVVGVLEDDRLATLEDFLKKIPANRVKEVCIDMKTGYRKVVQRLFPEARVVLDRFHVIADANKRMDEARRIEQDIRKQGKGRENRSIPKKIFLVGKEKLGSTAKAELDGLLRKYPAIQGFYWTKERLRELYQEESLNEARKKLDNLIMTLKDSGDAELNRWANTLRQWKEPLMNFFHDRTTNGYTEGCNTKAKMLKRVSFGMRNVTVYVNKIMLGFLPHESFHTI